MKGRAEAVQAKLQEYRAFAKRGIPSIEDIADAVLSRLSVSPAVLPEFRNTVLNFLRSFPALSLPENYENWDWFEFDKDHVNHLNRTNYLAGNRYLNPAIVEDTTVRLFEFLTPPVSNEPTPFQITFLEAVSSLRQFLEAFNAPANGTVFMSEWAQQLRSRLASDRDEYQLDSAKLDKIPLHQLNKTLFRDTPFFELFNLPVSIPFSHNTRFNHTHILGGTGAGKTTLLENLILYDLKSSNRPALIIVDSQGDLIRKISRLAVFNKELADALVIISPKDIDHPPALNIFDVNRQRLGTYSQAMREQVLAGVIQTFDYLFTGLLGADLTTKQGVFFKFIARLMLALPDTMGRNATILDMIRLMEDPSPYRVAVESLPDIQRNFFERDFQSKTFAQTKEQIRYRLHAIIENPTLARLFTAPHTKVDLFTELNNRSVILVDTAKDFLKGASANFGQIFISLILQAVLERAVILEKDRVPAFLFVDEAAEYFDANIDDLLTEARKQKLGCVFAHQYLDQCTSALRASLAANTSTKFAAGVSTADARAMAPEMRTTPDFILSQPRLTFATYIRIMTTHAVSIPVKLGTLENEPQLTDDQYDAMMVRNRERVSYTPETQIAAYTPPDEDVSDKW